MNIFVGNLNAQTTEKQLSDIFTPFGEIRGVKIITDNFTRRSRGFAFVEMPDDAQATTAIEKLHNTDLNEQPMTVNEARPKTTSENTRRNRY